MSDSNWNAPHLSRNESITIIAQFVVAPVLPAEADLAIVIDHNAFGIPFISLRSFFRFVGHFGTTWQWLQQPSGAIKKDAEKLIKYWEVRQSSNVR